MRNDLQKSLELIATVHSDIEQLELEYGAKRGALNNQLETQLDELARNSMSSEAERATVLRFLYWETNVGAKSIANAFGLTVQKITKLSGAKQIVLKCGCGTEVKVMATSRSHRDSLRDRRSWRSSECSACTKRRNEAAEIANTKYNRAKAQRREELLSMDWEEYIDTPEWKNGIGDIFHYSSAGFNCQVCSKEIKRLRIYPRIGIEQSFPNKEADYLRVCKGCLPRVSGLVDAERFDIYTEAEYDRYIEQKNGY